MKSFILGINFQTRRKSHRPSLFERNPGQAILLIAFLMIVLVGFTGLALDGGELYFLQRDAQNGADASLLASLYAWCGYPHMNPVDRDALLHTEGERAATQNGFTNGVNGATVTITRPSAPPGGGPADDNLIRVMITGVKPSRLIQVVYNGPLQATVTAQGKCTPASEFTQAAAMMGIGECDDPSHPGIDMSGSSMDVTGDPAAFFTNGLLDQTGATVNTTGTTTTNPSPSIVVPEFWNIAEFAPGGPVNTWITNEHPGAYHSFNGDVDEWLDWGISSNNPTPGVYYASGNITLGPADFDPDTDVHEMTIVAGGQITIQLPGSSDYQWTPYPIDNPDDPAYYGFRPVNPTFFTPYDTLPNCHPTPNAAIDIGNVLDFSGAIYAPYGSVKLSLAAGVSVDGGIMAESIKFSGSGVVIVYDPDSFPPIPPQISTIQ
jgi:hypothetical protein